MKTSKRFLALMLSALMIFSVAFVPGADLSMFGIEAEAATTLGGITQQRVVSNYESLYKQYQARFFTGAESNEPTNFVIPGLSSSNDYTPQGMTYWAEKEWILISAYDASGSGKHSVIYALDAVTTEFVALFKILNSNGSVNTSHGGGIAASEHNFYYADTGSNISYFPLSEMDVPKGTVKEIKLMGSINCGGELGGAATSYCCYEDGVLWAGNFYYDGDDRYKTSAHSASNSMIVGYRLHGNSSAEEWYYLSTNFNLIKLNTDSTDEQTIGTLKIRTYNTDGANAEVRGTITTDAALGEVTHSFASLKLTEGKKYKVEFIADNNLSDLYMFAPNGTHCNVKQSQASKITPLGNGKYHYQMIFTAGLKPAGADSSWPTTQSTNGTYTGTYTMRFDQDSVPAGGRTFNMTDISVTEYVEPNGFTPNSNYEGTGCAGNPTYVVMIAGIDKIQYAMVYKGKFYISRSWKRTDGNNHTRELMVGDIDLNSPGTANLVINGRTRPCHMINIDNVRRFGGDNGGKENLNQMFYMGEALCVIEDYLYMFGEGAAWAYNGKESNNKCPEPIDVIWKIDQHMIMGEERTYDDTAPQYYQKINSLSEINLNDDYLIVHESSLKDPVTQKNILYAFDSYGGYGANKLPKQDAGTQANSADSMGMIGYKISDYSIDTDEKGNQIIYVPEEVDTTKSLHWQIQGATSGNLRINNKDLYYAKNNHLYFGSRLFAMTTDARKNLDLLTLEQVDGEGSGNFSLYYKGSKNYYLWCNDGSNPEYIKAYTDYYSNHGKSGYVPQYHGTDEVVGTFHCDAGSLHTEAANSGNILGKAVGEDMKTIHIYKRVADPYSSAYETRVSTDLTAELQQDGTYNIKLETYAISELQYQTVAERPTDFIFVLDTSGSMTTEDCNGYHRHNAFDLEAAAGTEDAAGKTNNNSNSGTVGTYIGNMWIQHTDGVLCQVSVKVQGDGRKYEFPSYTYYQRVYLWYTHPTTGIKYYFHPSGDDAYGTWTTTETTYDQAMRIGASSKGDRAGRVVFRGVCYEKRSNSSRLSNMQIAVNQLIWKIQEKAQSTGLDHRVALVQYGSNSSGSWTNMGMYTNSSTSRVPYTGEGTISAANYKNAFHSVSQFNNAKNIVNNLSPSGDTFVDFGFDMAYNIIKNSDAKYTADGNRSACVIMITDGCPGFGGDDSSTANTVANAAIKNAADIKKAGGFIYTIQMGNNSMSGFDMDKYMDYTSSEFLFAKSMSEPGDRNTKDIAYKIDVPIAGFNLDFLVSSIFESVTSNSTNAIATLNANSILREHLTDAFIIPDGTKPEIKVAMADYDGIGRLYFEDPTSPTDTITATINTAENEILVSGYDYSTRFVSKSNVDAGLSQKLIVTIKGVIANADAELTNTSINNTTNTAIYQNNEFMKKNSAVKRFPTEYFTIPEYTYILDYGIGMYDNDINGKLLSVDSEPCKQDTYKKVLETDNIGMTFTNSNLDMIYNVLPHADGNEATSRGYCLIERDDGTYDWFRINILPASNVYYEEFHGTNQSNGSYVKWTHDTSDMKKFNQELTGEHDIYGYDINYLNDKSAFSYGTTYKSEVSAASGKNRTESIKFNYTGTAIDIVASCGEETGIYIVTVKNGNTVEKVYIVDTYFTDSAILNGIDQLNQVPIIHHENKDNNGEMLYGTHSVEITSVYLSSMIGARKAASTMSLRGSEDITYYSADITEEAKEAILELSDMEYLLGEDVEVIFFDENSVLNGGTGVEGASDVNAYATFSMRASEPERDFTTLKNYFDGFRVYNALADNTFSYVKSEQGATYYNVINSLATANSFLTGQGNNFVGYLEGDDEATIEFADYKKTSAPTNEVYLANNTGAISFKVPQGYQKLMVSFRAVTGEPKAKIGGQELPPQFAVIGATEMYYDITSYIGEDGLVTIQNSGTGLLAVNNIKVVNGALMPVMMSMLPRVRMMMAAPAADVDPNVPDDNTGDVNFPEFDDGTVVPGSDLDLDAEGFIPDYVPEENVNDSDSILNIFEDILAEIRSFFDMIIRFFKTLFA